MELMAYISSLLLASKPTTHFESSTAQNFTLQVWLDNSPLNQQSVSWFPNPDSEKPGFFGIPIRSPADPLPVGDRAILVRDSDFPDSLFFAEPDSQINKVFVQASGEVEYAVDLPTEFFKPYTGNFSTVDYTHWPDLETIHVLEFEPPGFILAPTTGNAACILILARQGFTCECAYFAIELSALSSISSLQELWSYGNGLKREEELALPEISIPLKLPLAAYCWDMKLQANRPDRTWKSKLSLERRALRSNSWVEFDVEAGMAWLGSKNQLRSYREPITHLYDIITRKFQLI
ncbi:hypothetical protein LZ554_002559 [Drepanopeziza brunnea f. sp. 'monogermtubi']|nr:hypothetical protein LZ554_002559 [Drepanopeziza brunnea f. sp. 'monogermtubi']